MPNEFCESPGRHKSMPLRLVQRRFWSSNASLLSREENVERRRAAVIQQIGSQQRALEVGGKAADASRRRPQGGAGSNLPSDAHADDSRWLRKNGIPRVRAHIWSDIIPPAHHCRQIKLCWMALSDQTARNKALMATWLNQLHIELPSDNRLARYIIPRITTPVARFTGPNLNSLAAATFA